MIRPIFWNYILREFWGSVLGGLSVGNRPLGQSTWKITLNRCNISMRVGMFNGLRINGGVLYRRFGKMRFWAFLRVFATKLCKCASFSFPQLFCEKNFQNHFSNPPGGGSESAVQHPPHWYSGLPTLFYTLKKNHMTMKLGRIPSNNARIEINLNLPIFDVIMTSKWRQIPQKRHKIDKIDNSLSILPKTPPAHDWAFIFYVLWSSKRKSKFWLILG